MFNYIIHTHNNIYYRACINLVYLYCNTYRVRVGIHWLVTKPFFDGFIMFVILLSSAALAAEDPVQENHPRNKLLKVFDYGFTGIFGVECLLKVRRLTNLMIMSQ